MLHYLDDKSVAPNIKETHILVTIMHAYAYAPKTAKRSAGAALTLNP